MSPVELQLSIERFTGQFLDSIAQTMYPFDVDADPKRRRVALRLTLDYASSSLDVATGPVPQVNLLDMIVFVTLCRRTLESHWGPKVLGEPCGAVIAAFARSEQNLWNLSTEVLDATQREQVREAIDGWWHTHPDQVKVEWVRFQDFAGIASELSDRDRSGGGLFSSVLSATQTADQAVLLAERALFSMHRLPFILRLHTRLAVQDALDDGLGRLQTLCGAVFPQLGGLARKLAVSLLALGLAWSVLFWGVYYLVTLVSPR